LEYAGAESYVVRLKENPDLKREINQVLPQLTFEMTGMKYDSDRKLASTGRRVTALNGNTSALYTQLNPVPYNLYFSLSIMTRNAEDAGRIIEQIVPYFTPDITTTITVIPQMQDSRQIPIVLDSVQIDNEYFGALSDVSQLIVWKLDFTMKAYFFGPVTSSGLIKEIILNFYGDVANGNIIANTGPAEVITIQPGVDANGNPTEYLANSIPLANIQPTANYGFIYSYSGLIPD